MGIKFPPMKNLSYVLLLLGIAACQQPQEKTEAPLNYPQTKKVDTVDYYFGTDVPDPYRWLEDDRSPETEAWVKEENGLTFGYLDKIPYRDQLKQRLETLYNYEKFSAPFKEGDYTYFYKNDGLQNQYVIYRYKTGEDPETAEVFLDPNTFKEDGTISLDALNFSENGRYAAYSISEGGSDWRKVITMDAVRNEIVGDTLKNVKFSYLSWKGNDGFYYSSYDKPEGSELSEKTDQHKLYYHALGTPQSADVLVFGGDPTDKYRYVFGSVSEDSRFLTIQASNVTSGYKFFIQDLQNPNGSIITLIDHMDSENTLLRNEGDVLYIMTNLNAPNYKIVKATISDPLPENWVDFIPETESVLSASSAGNYIFAEYMIDAISKVYQYTLAGERIREVQLPGVGSVGGMGAKKGESETYFSFTNYITPTSIYILDLETGTTSLYRKPDIDFNPEDYESVQVFYTSKDGTKVPMIISHKKGIRLNDANPTMLYGYGGFNVSKNPVFSLFSTVWMELGGVYAVANIRGGGEYGKEWHKAGTQMQKQNVFDDFIAAGEYLIDNHYTSSDYLAIRGGSNGGLLVGAVMTQRPDLVKVALPAVGVLDMLRYHKFTSGAGWSFDYGTSEDSKEMFDYLYGYSPLHNVKEGVAYPATMITTGDHDDRVVPAHSFKFAAELQEKQAGPNPVLIRIETDAGHGAGTPISKTIDEYADIFGFTLYNMGYDELPETINQDLKK